MDLLNRIWSSSANAVELDYKLGRVVPKVTEQAHANR